MINEDILTSLKNAIEKGESLQTAMAICINSGYSQREVEEAAKFIGEGVIEIEKISQEQLLAMPNQKKVFRNFFAPRITGTYVPPKVENTIPNATQPSTPQAPILPPQPLRSQPQIQARPFPQSQSVNQIKQNISPPLPLRIDPTTPVRIRPPRQSYAKEIILLIILLILIVILVVVFKFRDQIITFFSG